jgi:diguanylate cyclase (GGDEF)-like protein
MPDTIAALETRLKHASTQREKIDALNDLAWEIRNEDNERAISLAQTAYELSFSGDFSGKPYSMGQASSLTTRAYLDRNGPLGEALDKCFKALALIESEAPNLVSVRCMRLICWLYFYLGDLSNALTYGLKALDVAKAGDHKDLTAAVLSSLTMVFAVAGDLDQALAKHEEALGVAREINDELQEMVAFNQGANVYLGQGNLERALDLATRAWEIAQRLETDESRVDVSDTLGEVLQAIGDYEQAEKLLIETIDLDTKLGSEWGQAHDWLGLGRLHISQDKLAQAEADLQKSLEISKKIGLRQLQMEWHENLYQIYERQNNWEDAFAQLKAFHELYKENHNDSASRKIALLNVAHQVETSRRDAEIYHLRNEELLREIEERKKVEKALEELAVTDPLTGLFNRRHFFNIAEFLLAEATRYKHPLSLIILDIDHFKQVNDTYGHAVGDEAIKLLSATIKTLIRASDVAARFGGDEFVLLLPETNLEQAVKFADRLRFSLKDKTFSASQIQFHFTISIGVAGFLVPSNSVDELLEHADRALYAAKQEGKNQVQVYQRPENH